MGEVYRARDSRLDRVIALKVLKDARLHDSDQRARFLQEAGFSEIAVTSEQLGYYLPNVEQSWALIWNTGARIPLQYLPPPLVEQIKAEYLAMMAESTTDQGVWIDWQALFCLGRKPPHS